MADVALHDLIGTSVVTNLISRIKTPMQRFQNFLGMGPGGVAVDSPGGRHFNWDIFDNSRNIGQLRAPASGPSNISPFPIGKQNAVALRSFEKINLEWERIFRTRPLGQPYGTVDITGQRYVARQARYLGQRNSNLREFVISRMLQGEVYAELKGQEWVVTNSATNSAGGGNMKIDYGIPATNKGDLDGILTDWSNTNTNIHSEILAVSRKFEREHGWPLRHIWLNSVYMDAIMRNDSLKSLAGTANIVFQRYQPTGLENVEGIEDTGYNLVLTGIPWLTWHVYDAGLHVGGDGDSFFETVLPDKKAVFMPDPDPMLMEMYLGSEMVVENQGDPPYEAFGTTGYVTQERDPAAMEMKNLDNFLPVLYVPKAVAFGDIVP